MKIKNIQTSAFLQNLTKAYTEGVYADTSQNRKEGKVGLNYTQFKEKLWFDSIFNSEAFTNETCSSPKWNKIVIDNGHTTNHTLEDYFYIHNNDKELIGGYDKNKLKLYLKPEYKIEYKDRDKKYHIVKK